MQKPSSCLILETDINDISNLSASELQLIVKLFLKQKQTNGGTVGWIFQWFWVFMQQQMNEKRILWDFDEMKCSECWWIEWYQYWIGMFFNET